METLADLTARHAGPGRIDWIGLRPERLAGVTPVDQADLTERGLDGDHSRPGNRALTLIQAEHLPAIAALAGVEEIYPGLLRRNLVVSGINLTALRHHVFRIGGVVLKGVEPCAPCSRMEEALGPGGYNAMRGHGGLCAAVLEGGVIQVGDRVKAVQGA